MTFPHLHFFFLPLKFPPRKLLNNCLCRFCRPGGVIRDSCRVLNRFPPFPLVAFKIPDFNTSSLSSSAWIWCSCRACCFLPCYCSSSATEVASHASGALFTPQASFSMSPYSSILHPLCTSMLLKKTSKLLENNIELTISVRYTIKNGFVMMIYFPGIFPLFLSFFLSTRKWTL